MESDHKDIYDEAQPAYRQMMEPVFEKSGRQLCTSCGRPFLQHKTHRDPEEHSSEHTPEKGIRFREFKHCFRDVYQQRAYHYGEQRGYEHPYPLFFYPYYEERYVHDKDHGTYRQSVEKEMNALGKSRESSDCKTVGFKKAVERNGVYRARKCDNRIIP